MDITLIIITYSTVDTTLKDISPSLVPSSAGQRRTSFYITQLLSLLDIISSSYHWSVVLKKKGGALPCSPSDNDLIVSPFAPAQKPGPHSLCKLPAATILLRNTVATDTNDVTFGWTNHSERIGILVFLSRPLLNFPHYSTPDCRPIYYSVLQPIISWNLLSFV